MKVFLGGTVNGSTWLDQMIPELDVDFFNPVVDDWNEAAYEQELHERVHADFCLYVITPKMTGFYAIAEAVDDSNKRPGKTLFCILEDDDGESFNAHQKKSLVATSKLIAGNGAKTFQDLSTLISFLNAQN